MLILERNPIEIIDFESKTWFFLSYENNNYIDVNCNYSFVGFNMLIQLNQSELDEYKNYGRDYIDSLVKDIQQYALSKYEKRNIKGNIERLANEAVIKFLEKSRQ